VCKKAPPTDCPFGEIVAETIAINPVLPNDWLVRGQWLIPGLEQVLTGTLTAICVNGVPTELTQAVDSATPFQVTVVGLAPGKVAILYLGIKSDQNCDYLKVASAFIPLPPLD